MAGDVIRRRRRRDGEQMVQLVMQGAAAWFPAIWPSGRAPPVIRAFAGAVALPGDGCDPSVRIADPLVNRRRGRSRLAQQNAARDGEGRAGVTP
jgi:hypothetical protein